MVVRGGREFRPKVRIRREPRRPGAGSDARHRRPRRSHRATGQPAGDDRRLVDARLHERGDLPHRPVVAGGRRLRDGAPSGHGVPVSDLRAAERARRVAARPRTPAARAGGPRRRATRLVGGAQGAALRAVAHGRHRGLVGARARPGRPADVRPVPQPRRLRSRPARRPAARRRHHRQAPRRSDRRRLARPARRARQRPGLAHGPGELSRLRRHGPHGAAGGQGDGGGGRRGRWARARDRDARRHARCQPRPRLRRPPRRALDAARLPGRHAEAATGHQGRPQRVATGPLRRRVGSRW